MEKLNGQTSGYTIKIAAKRTGLSQHIIRMWERRYHAVIPHRTETNRRLYSDSDIEKLCLLQKATVVGHSIGQIASLSLPELKEMIRQDIEEAEQPRETIATPLTKSSPDFFLTRCLEALKVFDTDAIEKLLLQASISLSQPDIIEKIVNPIMVHVGKCWQQGTMRVAHEHAVSGVIRTFLGNFVRMGNIPEHAPRAIITTPSGQLHEIGALMAAVSAASDGWHITYLGPNLPAQEIAVATMSSNAKAVLLSIVFPQDDPYLVDELKNLRKFLPAETAIIVGGRAAEAYEPFLSTENFIILHDLKRLRSELESLRIQHKEQLAAADK